MNTVTLYTRTVCPKCMLVKQMLDNAEIVYDVVNIDHDKEAENTLKEKGFMGLPIALHEGAYYLEQKEIQSLIEKIAE